jgi:hypothetical protein
MRRLLARHRPTPSMTIALIALLVAMGGTGYAAVKLPKNSVGAAQLKKNAVTSAKVKDRSLTARDFKPGDLPAGPKGDVGAKGDQGPRGDQGPKGDTGATGQTGQPGPFPATLPQGKTVTGAWATSGVATAGGQAAYDDLSFGWPLASDYAVDVVSTFPSTDPHCPGTLGAPTAEQGYLCVYQRATHNASGFTYSTSGVLYKMGAPYWITSSAAGAFDADGTWAVTGN